MITNEAKKKIALFIREIFNGGKTKLGTGGGGTNPSSIILDVPLPASTDKTHTVISSDDKVIEFKSEFLGSTLQGYTIREVGIFGDVPKNDQFDELVNTNNTANPEYTTDNIMLSRINFNAIGNFSTSDTIEVIYTMEVE